MTGQCSELILLIWSVWSGYRAIRVLYLSSSPIPSSLSQYSVSPSLSRTINNITTSDNHTASYRTSHTQFTQPQTLPGSYSSITTLCPLYFTSDLKVSVSHCPQSVETIQRLISNIPLFYCDIRNIIKGKNYSLQYICYLNSNLRLSFCISI